jgi:hypothetical protein
MARGRRADLANRRTSMICRLHLRNIRFMPSLEVESVVERAE